MAQANGAQGQRKKVAMTARRGLGRYAHSAYSVGHESNHTRCVRSNLAAEISRRDLTQARAAALAGLTPDGLSKRMSGQVEFRLGELLELARVLGVPFATLVAGIDAADEQLAEA